MPMKMGWRWYGEGNDPISLSDIKQIPGVTSIVWALHDKMPGEIWEIDEIQKVADQIHAYGFDMDVVESVNVHDDIKIVRVNGLVGVTAYGAPFEEGAQGVVGIFFGKGRITDSLAGKAPVKRRCLVWLVHRTHFPFVQRTCVFVVLVRIHFCKYAAILEAGTILCCRCPKVTNGRYREFWETLR